MAASRLLTVSSTPSPTGSFSSPGIPTSGAPRDEDLRPGLSFPVGEYVIIYRIEDEDVLILRVVRGSRNIEALFGH